MGLRRYSARGRTCMPLINRSVKLDSRVSADVSRVRHLLEQLLSVVSVSNLSGCYELRRPIFVSDNCMHELVSHSNTVICVLEEYATVRFSIYRSIVSSV